MKTSHVLIAVAVLASLATVPVLAQLRSPISPAQLPIQKNVPEIAPVDPLKLRDVGGQTGEKSVQEVEGVQEREVKDPTACIRSAEAAFMNQRTMSWQQRQAAIEAAWKTYSNERDVAWKAYVVAKKPLDAAFESSTKAARTAKDENALLAARESRDVAHRSVLRNLTSERQRAHDAWVKARGEAIVAWQRSFRSASDLILKARTECAK